MISSSQKSHVSHERHSPHATSREHARVALMCGVLFLSGAGALIFETLWLRLSGLAFGNSIWAAFLILLAPTTAMGLTLPVMIEDPLLREAEFSRAIGFLYGSNTLGAMAGTIFGEAYLIRAFGLYGTSLAAGAAVWIAAITALLVARSQGIFTMRQYSTAQRRSLLFPFRFEADYRPPWRLLFVSFGSGLMFLALEVVW